VKSSELKDHAVASKRFKMQAVRTLARRVAGNVSTGSRGISTGKASLAGHSGAREAQLLEKDPALAKYHSVKSQVQAIKRFGDVLVILVTAGAVYEIAYKVQQRNAAQAEETSTTMVATESAE